MPNANRQKCSNSRTISSGIACDVDLNQFGPCIFENHFGYKTGTPCVFLKLKKVKDWMPTIFNYTATLPKTMPENLRNEIQRDGYKNPKVWLSCKGDNPADVENAGIIEYFPQNGYPTYYFPYTNQEGYLEPLVAIQFKKPACKLMKNIFGVFN